MKFYNTLTRKIEEFVPRVPGQVRMYTCGPTVYHYAHIGNLRTYMMEDLLEKALCFEGYEVMRVMNITDVGHLTSDGDTGDDKMLKGAQREHKTVMEIASFYEKAFFEDCDALNIKKPATVVPATSCIDSFLHVIGELLARGYAYSCGGNIYFDTSKLKEYNVLTGHKSEELMVGVRDDVGEDANKKSRSDFVLWFTKSKFADQELKWDSPFGVGYPGWHIECSCISMKYLGEYLDIHCGGVDNIFPHHTNEIAQSEAYLGHEWCHYWFHTHHLNDESGKMSKSKGAFLTVSLLRERGYDPLAYRLFCLQSHYRRPLTFSFEALDNAALAYTRLRARIAALGNEGTVDPEAAAQWHDRFGASLTNDLNSAMALTAVYDVLKADCNDATKRAILQDFDRVLSLDLLKGPVVTAQDASVQTNAEEAAEIEQAIAARAAAKAARDYAEADRIRAELLSRGIVLVDTKEGTAWKRSV